MNQQDRALQNAYNPATCSTSCSPGTYEGSAGPYDHDMAGDDSSTVTATSGPPHDQNMMSTAVLWDGTASNSGSQGYVNQQPGCQRFPMTRGSLSYHEVSTTGMQASIGVLCSDSLV